MAKIEDEPADPTRRKVLQGLGAGATLAMTGCSSVSLTAQTEGCPPPEPSDRLIVDMHCHIMNLEDADRAVFLNRHIFNTDESPFSFLNAVVNGFERLLAWPALQFTDKARAERAFLRDDFIRMQETYQDFCEIAAKRQDGLFFARVDRQVSGFFSNRTRNAARLMELYPTVDLFTPSIVDFNEGAPGEYSSIIEQAMLYSAVAVATRGRILPIMSFHPERSFAPNRGGNVEEEAFNFKLQLKLVEFAVTQLGFIGVKVHPSTGFAPIRNQEFGCPNTRKQYEDELPKEKAKRFDEAMCALYGLCRRLDVPIITHNSLGILANKSCIRRKDKYSYSPNKWLQAVTAANELDHDYSGLKIPKENRLRVCLGHFADGFEEGAGEPTDWLKEAVDALKSKQERNQRNIFLDLSDLTEWFTRDRSEIRDSYQKAFKRLLDADPCVADRIMYGTDWHMPGTAMIGRRYLPAMSELIDQTLSKENALLTLGGNAAEFFKLKNGQMPRQRIEKFLKDNGVNLEDVGWCRKVDQLGPGSLIS